MQRFMLAVAVVAGLAAMSLHAAGNADTAFKAFWDAPTTAAAEKTVHGIVDSGVDFDGAWMRLKSGRMYAKEKTGLIRHPSSVGGVTVPNMIEIPAEYDPAKKWPLRVQ